MQPAQKDALIDRLLALFAAQAPQLVPGASLAALRQPVAQAIEDALTPSPTLDSRRVTILLSDLRGFTALAERFTALEMVEALNRYFNRMTEIIVRHGGTIDKFMGDAIMVLFGAPVARPDDVQAALACAIEMQLAMADINADNRARGMAPLYMGIGINTGEVVAGHLGSALHNEYTVIGEQVNLASRIEAHSLRGQILLSEATWLLARDYVDTGAVNEVRVKGKKDSVRMIELLATRAPRVLLAPPREARNSPRVQVDMPLTFQLLQHKQVLPEKITARVIDISYGGLSIHSPLRLEPFSHLKMVLSLALLGTEQAEIYAMVLQVAPAKAGPGTEAPGYECRIELTSISAPAAQALKEFVDGLVELGTP